MVKWDVNVFFFQLILKASAGIDFTGFYSLISFIAKKRLNAVSAYKAKVFEPSANAEKFEADGLSQNIIDKGVVDKENVTFLPFSPNHNIFDLVQIRDVLAEMLKESEFLSIFENETILSDCDMKPVELLDMIKTVLQDVSSWTGFR